MKQNNRNNSTKQRGKNKNKFKKRKNPLNWAYLPICLLKRRNKPKRNKRRKMNY